MIQLNAKRRLDELRKRAEQHSRNLEAARVQESITNAIGDRRGRELLDQISEIEKHSGWEHVVEILASARVAEYSTPIALGFQKRKLEPLKFREVLFELFSCSGFEPIDVPTEEILGRLHEVDSFVKANALFQSLIEDYTLNQVQSGDLLFFSGDSLISDITKRINSLQESQMENLVLPSVNGNVQLQRLWRTELGRRLLADLGIKGTTLDFDSDVIQILTVSFPGLTTTTEEQVKVNSRISNIPSLPVYDRLLTAIIHHDIEDLQNLGSQWAYPILDYYVSESLRGYLESDSTEQYRSYLNGLNAHIAVRAAESIATFQKLIERIDVPRVSEPAALAMGNFFTESAIAVLLEKVCSTLDETSEAALKALQRIHDFTPEAEPMIRLAAEGNCRSAARLKGILETRIWSSSS